MRVSGQQRSRVPRVSSEPAKKKPAFTCSSAHGSWLWQSWECPIKFKGEFLSHKSQRFSKIKDWWIIIDHQFIIMIIKDNHHFYWLVVSTPLKNIGQLGLLFPIYGKKIKNVPNHVICDNHCLSLIQNHQHDDINTITIHVLEPPPVLMRCARGTPWRSLWSQRGCTMNRSGQGGGIVSTCHRGSNRRGTDGKMDGHTDGKWWKRMEIPWNTFGGDFLPVFFSVCFRRLANKI